MAVTILLPLPATPAELRAFSSLIVREPNTSWRADGKLRLTEFEGNPVLSFQVSNGLLSRVRPAPKKKG